MLGSPETLHRIEMAEQNVTLKTLEQICVRLKCGVKDVFGERLLSRNFYFCN